MSETGNALPLQLGIEAILTCFDMLVWWNLIELNETELLVAKLKVCVFARVCTCMHVCMCFLSLSAIPVCTGRH